MDKLRFILKGFGYRDFQDAYTTMFKIDITFLSISAVLGALRLLVQESTGLDVTVAAAFVFLIVAEFQTGVKVSLRKGNKVQSRKLGRMVLKVGVYFAIIAMLYTFSRNAGADVLGFEINPFKWLYNAVFTAIVFQLFISWMENLGCLGYHETKTLAGFILRKFNKWFEFDGSKDNGTE